MQKVREHVELPLFSQPPQWEAKEIISITVHSGLSDALGSYHQRCKFSVLYSFVLPLPWCQDLASRHSSQSYETRWFTHLSWNSLSQWEQCVSIGGNLKKSSCLQMDFIECTVCFCHYQCHHQCHPMNRNLLPNAYSYILSLKKKLHKIILYVTPFQKAYIAQIRKHFIQTIC